jgi:hypothetical protein
VRHLPAAVAPVLRAGIVGHLTGGDAPALAAFLGCKVRDVDEGLDGDVEAWGRDAERALGVGHGLARIAQPMAGLTRERLTQERLTQERLTRELDGIWGAEIVSEPHRRSRLRASVEKADQSAELLKVLLRLARERASQERRMHFMSSRPTPINSDYNPVDAAEAERMRGRRFRSSRPSEEGSAYPHPSRPGGKGSAYPHHWQNNPGGYSGPTGTGRAHPHHWQNNPDGSEFPEGPEHPFHWQNNPEGY